MAHKTKTRPKSGAERQRAYRERKHAQGYLETWTRKEPASRAARVQRVIIDRVEWGANVPARIRHGNALSGQHNLH